MEQVSINDPRPLLVYDGDCGFCTYWVRYWQQLTGDRVAYAPYQETAAQYPEIPVTAFQNAHVIENFEPNFRKGAGSRNSN